MKLCFTTLLPLLLATSVFAADQSSFGIKLLLNQAGLNAWKLVADNATSDALSRQFLLPSYTKEESWPWIKWVAQQLSNIRVTAVTFSKPQSTVRVRQGVNKAFLELEMATFRMSFTANYRTQTGSLATAKSGSVRVDCSVVKLLLSGTLVSRNGGLSVADDSTLTCDKPRVIGPTIVQLTGDAADLTSAARDNFILHVQSQLPAELCRVLKTTVQSAITTSLEKYYPTSLTILKRLQLDNKVLRARYALNSTTMVIGTSGQVSAARTTNMTLLATDLPWVRVPEGKQTAVQFAEPVLQSGLQAAVQSGMLNTVVDEQFFEHDRDFVQLNCTESQSSLGCVLPSLRQKYPDERMQIRISTERVPTVKIQVDGSINCDFASTLHLDLIRNSHSPLVDVLVATGTLGLSISNLRIEDRILKGSVELRSANLSGHLETADSNLVQWPELNEVWQALALSLADVHWNRRLTEGFLVDDLVQGISLVDLQLRVFQKSILLSGNFNSF